MGEDWSRKPEAITLLTTQMAPSRKSICAGSGVLLALFGNLPFACAEESAVEPSPTAPMVQPTAEHRWPPEHTIRRSQFEAFVELVGEPQEEVLRRLHADPELLSLAGPAADARRVRERRGKAMTTIGFTTVGAGITVSAILLLLSGPAPGVCEGSECNELHLSDGAKLTMVVSLMAAALGLGTGVLGILTLTGQTDIEKTAVDRYQKQSTQSQLLGPTSAPTPAANTPRHGFALPVLSFAF
jgi:hypothetical protein